MRETLRPLPPAYIRGDYPDIPAPAPAEGTSTLQPQHEDEALPPYSRTDPLATPAPAVTPELSSEEILAEARAITERWFTPSIRREARSQTEEDDDAIEVSSFRRVGDLEAAVHVPKIDSPTLPEVGAFTAEASNIQHSRSSRPRRKWTNCCCCQCGIVGWVFWMFWVVVIAICAGVAFKETN
jgi:hypothetical protein